MSVFIMLPTGDGAAFKKGETITCRAGSSDFGDRINNNPKFKIVEILGIQESDIESLFKPLVTDIGTELEVTHANREFIIDVDQIADREKVSIGYLMSLAIRQEAPVDVQTQEVVV